MAKKGDFPKQLFVTIEGEKGETWLCASRNIDDAFNGSDNGANPMTVAMYELKTVGQVRQSTNWESE